MKKGGKLWFDDVKRSCTVQADKKHNGEGEGTSSLYTIWYED